MAGEVIDTDSKCVLCRLHGQATHASPGLPAVSAVFAELRSPSILGGNASVAAVEGFSYWAADPREVFEFTSDQEDPFARLEKLVARYKIQGSPPPELPSGLFQGGWIGYFSYELGRFIERLPETTIDDFAIPLIRLCFYDRLIAYDHRNGTFWLVALELPDDLETPKEKMAGLERLLKASENLCVAWPRAADLERIDLSRARSNMTREDYLRTVGRIRRYIRDGEVYQVNFSQRFDRPFTGRPVELFHWQNHYNPSPYAAYVGAGNFQIVIASPEMFISTRDGLIQTKPIKGTRRRFGPNDERSDKRNEQNLRDLLSSSKEQAELNMIVDLERNDVARICRPGTRRVIQPRTIEAYPTVFHAVATVGGQLRHDVRLTDIFRAVFPGGSITGAPKIRAMEIIDELEPTARSVYTGSIGFIGIDGTVCLNIAIRTVIIAAHKAFVQTGGGIVADSEPEAEWEETITKARALLAGIDAVQEP
ncbi:MAG: anthranilate synthase component I family protein [Phycisphaerales bacterium]|nr:MAG: anthranilate synthase component I family protein [Phycisphaerales bacterium]